LRACRAASKSDKRRESDDCENQDALSHYVVIPLPDTDRPAGDESRGAGDPFSGSSEWPNDRTVEVLVERDERRGMRFQSWKANGL
jgi:hypothetical protein